MTDIHSRIETDSRARRRLYVAYLVFVYALVVYVLIAFISMALEKLSYIDWSLALPPAGVWISVWLMSRWLTPRGTAEKPVGAKDG